MRMLILSPRFPDAAAKADAMTVFRLIRHFSQRHGIYLACFYENEAELEKLPDLKRYCSEVRCVRLKKRKSLWNLARHLVTSLPLQTAYYLDSEMRRAVDDLLERFHPDLAYAHLIRMAEYLKNHREVKRVLALQIAQTLNYRRMIENINVLFYKILYGVEYRKVRRYEPAVIRRFDTCLLISRYDKESLDGHEQIKNVVYSPHGVDVAYYTKRNEVEKESAVLFCGVLETPTNLDAALWFYNDIYPLIKQQVPDVRLYLAGRNPRGAIRKIAQRDSSVVVTGFVKDLRPYYERVRVGIDPLRIGAGLQNKLLIGMSMEQPMVCTSVANEGIGAENGKHLLIADDPESFASAVVELLRDEEKANRIGRDAREYVEQFWTWEYHFDRARKSSP